MIRNFDWKTKFSAYIFFFLAKFYSVAWFQEESLEGGGIIVSKQIVAFSFCFKDPFFFSCSSDREKSYYFIKYLYLSVFLKLLQYQI